MDRSRATERRLRSLQRGRDGVKKRTRNAQIYAAIYAHPHMNFGVLVPKVLKSKKTKEKIQAVKKRFKKSRPPSRSGGRQASGATSRRGGAVRSRVPLFVSI